MATEKTRSNFDFFSLPGGRSPQVVVQRSRWSALGSHLYWMRGYDTGLGQHVIWGPTTNPAEALSPNASQTTPNFTGTIQSPHVYLIK